MAAIAVAVAACAAQALFMWVPGNGWSWVSTALTALFALTAAAAGLCACRGQQTAPTAYRLAWLLIGAGLLLRAAGDLAYNGKSVLSGSSPDSPYFTDWVYFAAYAALLGGILGLAGFLSQGRRSRLAVDSLLTASTFATAAWFLAVQPIWSVAQGSTLQRGIASAYVGFSCVLFFAAVAVVLAARRARQPLGPTVWLALGAALMAFSDALWVVLELRDEYFVGGFLDTAWIVAYGLTGVAALASMRSFPPPQARQAVEATGETSWQVVLFGYTPYVVALFVAGAAVLDEAGLRGYVSNTTLIPGVLLVVLAVIRQAVVVGEKQRELRELHRSLQQKVDERTRDLQIRYEFSKAVSSSLDPAKVLEVAASHLLRSMSADAVRLCAARQFWDELGVRSVSLTADGIDVGLPECIEGMAGSIGEVQIRPYGPTLDEAGMLLRAPVVWAGQSLGLLHVYKQDEGFTDEDAERAEAMGLEIGAALSNALQHRRVVAAARQDHVTGLMNHRAFTERLQQVYAHCASRREPVAMLVIDVANFKQFNDLYGRLAGDDVLRMVARRLTEAFGESGHLGRIGGDEFAVLLPGWDLERARAGAAALHEDLRRHGHRPTMNATPIPIALNAGIAANDFGCSSAFEMLARADSQLLIAKRRQRHTQVYAPAEDSESAEGGPLGVLEQLVTAIDNLDSYTRRHSEDVAEYALWIGAELACSQETMRAIRVAALLHDVGKICVPAPILRKPGRLTSYEFEVMKQHTVVGAMIVRAMPGGAEIADGVAYHHEHYDGGGYPQGLAGEEIPLLARILAVADAVSAITTDRPYRKGLDWRVALDAVRAGSGAQFDPRIVEAFLRAAAAREALVRAA
jgi:diguanylate cyclase (GGDEF)-like protein/putative nucleotidyltransferase with HDIG domain